MRGAKEFIPAILLGSGVVLTGVSLAVMVALGREAPPAFLAVMLLGLMDGIAGLVWTSVMLFGGRRDECVVAAPTPSPRPADEAAAREERFRQALVLANGLLAVIFLGVLLAGALYLHVIVACLKIARLF
ncbi:MAG: hypothetical protein PHD74_09745 [Candidatus Krumholzibacteria bacterium]|nr:hypothetical protein [Candidatus Krumholzibacteria bacterium]